MYKKITHTIVEEHFEHPLASDIKKTLERRSIKATIGMSEVISKAQFKTDINNFFADYIASAEKVINATTGTDVDLSAAEKAAFENVASIGEITKEIYPVEFVEKVNSILRSTTLALIQTVHLLRSNLDTKDWTNSRFNNLLAGDLAETLSKFNNVWQFMTVKDWYVALTTNWVNQAKARQAKNTTNEQAAANNVTNLAASFARTFADGVIAQHPDFFATP